jgi:hypothetical protein
MAMIGRNSLVGLGGRTKPSSSFHSAAIGDGSPCRSSNFKQQEEKRRETNRRRRNQKGQPAASSSKNAEDGNTAVGHRRNGSLPLVVLLLVLLVRRIQPPAARPMTRRKERRNMGRREKGMPNAQCGMTTRSTCKNNSMFGPTICFMEL